MDSPGGPKQGGGGQIRPGGGYLGGISAQGRARHQPPAHSEARRAFIKKLFFWNLGQSIPTHPFAW